MAKLRLVSKDVQSCSRWHPSTDSLRRGLPVYIALAYLVQQAHSTAEAFFLGLSVYTVYDFTNYAALSKYDPLFATADSLWGGVLFTLVRTIAVYLNIL